jgi:hypothetical protein
MRLQVGKDRSASGMLPPGDVAVVCRWVRTVPPVICFLPDM